MEIQTNYERAGEVARKAVSMLEQKVYPFNLPDLFPDAIVPDGIEKGSYKHALFLFYAVPLDSRRESKVAYKRARTLAQHLDFSKIAELGIDEVRKALKKHFEKNIETASGDPLGIFMKNSWMLRDNYDNNPRKIKAETVGETLKRIRKFYQYGKTNNALLLKNMVKAGIWDFPHDSFPIKIDRHAINISIGTGVIQLPENLTEIRFEKLVSPLDDVYQKVIKQEGVSAIDLNDALWGIGQYLCTPRKTSHCEMNCPLNCRIRPYTDRAYTTIILKQETRDPQKSLFKF